MGRLFKGYVTVLVVASVIQAMAVCYMFGAESRSSYWQDLVSDLYDKLYPEGYHPPWGMYSHPLRQPLGITTWVLLGFWFVAYAVWLARRE